MDETIESKVTIRSLEKSLEEESWKTEANNGWPRWKEPFPPRQQEEEESKKKAREKGDTNAREHGGDERAKAPVALSGGGSIPHHHEFARVQRFTNPPAVVCLSASCTLTTTSILNQTPPTLFFLSSFLATASVVPRGWCTHQPPFRRDRQLGACDELNYTRSKFDISFSSLFVSYTSIQLFFPANFGYRWDL